ncbi:hypothetical protein BX666DRAFT_1997840 [Dichotomocladium elegans]|nr:hypothetical protein BX666DRAFT_1997840 [Dichotomocladium elegans]
MKTPGIVLSLLVASATVMARSAVYMVSDGNHVDIPVDMATEKSTVPLDAFSMILSHMTDTTGCHPIEHMEEAYKQETIAGAKAVWSNRGAWWSHEQDDVFEKKLDNGLFIVVSGVNSPEAILPSPAFYVSDNVAEDYMAVADDTAQALEEKGRQVTVMSNLALMDIDVTDDSGVFDLTQQADITFIRELHYMKSVFQKDSDFIAIKMEGLQLLGKVYGVNSAQYQEAEHLLNDLFEKTVIPGYQAVHADQRSLITLVFTPGRYYGTSLGKRGLPVEPLQNEKTCFVTEAACLNETSSCSGRGSCVPAKDSCYICQCSSPSFLGSACEVQDAVADFQLLFWTGVTLIILTSGVLMFVYKSGEVGNGGVILVPQALPKQD